MIEETPADETFDFPEEPKEPKEPHLSSRETSALRAKIADPIGKIADWISSRDEELAEILRSDAPKMASMLSRLAANAHTPMIVVLGVQAFATLLEPIDAFGRTALHLFRRARERRENQIQQMQDVIPEPETETVPDFIPPPEPQDDTIARPWDLSRVRPWDLSGGDQ